MTDSARNVTSDDLFTRRQRETWRHVVALAADRAETESSISNEFREAEASSRQRSEETRAAIEKRRQRDTVKNDAARAAATRAATEQFDVEHSRTRSAFDRELAIISEKATTSESRTSSRLEEAVWLADTVYEASEDRPQEEYVQQCKVVQIKRDELDLVRTDAGQLLVRSRQRRLLATARPEPDSHDDAPADESANARLDACVQAAHDHLDAIRALRVPRLLIGLRLPALGLVLAAVAATVAAWRTGWQYHPSWIAAVGGAVVLAAIITLVLFIIARRRIGPIYRSLIGAAERGEQTVDACLREAEVDRDRQRAALIEARDRDIDLSRGRFEPILDEIQHRRGQHLARINEKYPDLLRSIETARDEALQSAETAHRERIERIRLRTETGLREAESRLAAAMEEAETRRDSRWQALETRWKDGMTQAYDVVQRIRDESAALFPPWDDASWSDWTPPDSPAPAVPFGRVRVDLDQVPGGLPTDERLVVPGPHQFDLPAMLALPDRGSLLVESGAEGGDQAIGTLQAVMARLLTRFPPGKVRYTIFDPVGLGQNFAGFMHLVDYLESLVSDKIWTETRHIEQRLVDLTDHMENVIQKYLRNEYETIAEYNEHAGEIAEPYRFLVIASFPINFSETAAKRLASIVSSGPRCGVFTLIHHDTRHALPKGIEPEDLRRNGTTLSLAGPTPRWCDPDYESLPLTLEPPPDDALLTRVLHEVGRAAKDSSRVEVPFEVVSPGPDERWSLNAAAELRVPLGRSGATKLQHLTLGHGTSQHVLIAGKTGSGKSTLLHVLITNVGLWYRPDEVELYLVDFKKGVEFKTYSARELPHARAVAIESDREFGLSVLQRLDRELKRRGELYRHHGVQDLAGFRAAAPETALPRTLLIIDEFQEFFVEDDKIGQDAALLLDRLVRQGRAFGVHVILGSQTLSGAYSLAKSTLGQMAVRIALQCSETDAYLIMSEDNSAARLLARPGEAIYNDSSGLIEGNSPFQIVWLSDRQRSESLDLITELAAKDGFEPPQPQIVFEGNAPADIRRNVHLEAALDEAPAAAPAAARAWLGDAVAIKDPTSAVFRRQTGSNLLIVGQRDESALAMMAVSMISLAAQHRLLPDMHVAGGVRFVLLDGSPADSPNAGTLARIGAVTGADRHVVGWREIPATMQDLAAEVDRRQGMDALDAPPIYLVIFGLQRFRDLRQSDDFGFSSYDEDKPPAADKLFHQVLRDGPLVGVHAIVWCDTMTNTERTIDRQAMREFDMRVAFQMGATDSSNLIDHPQASKLGMRHALFHSEESGVTEKFRPYALPDTAWIDHVAAILQTDGGVGETAGSTR